MWRFLCVCAALFTLPLSAQADLVITKPQVAGPVRLVCLNPNQLVGMVRSITRQQIIGITYVARDGQMQRGCDDVQLPVGTTVIHERWIQTRDGWWVMGQTVRYPNDFMVVTVDPMQARYRDRPIQFRRFYGGYYVPVIPHFDHVVPYRQYRNTRPRQRPHRERPNMTIKEGQQWMKQELQRLLK